MTEPGFAGRVAQVVARIPAGEWMTYGEVAAEAGAPGGARAAGRALRECPEGLPWWRVVGAGGRITSPASAEQARRLRAEGWEVEGGRITARRTAAPDPR